ncbi:MAG: hypothetical protein HUJ56_06820, partial [Erysipelotrichaceae bacterium]|nr:hypothetical protein [Erysipelotrichaceae bacterium]
TNRTTSEFNKKEKAELIDSITLNKDFENNQIIFTWSKDFYGNVKKVYVKETLRNEYSDCCVFPSPSYTSLKIKNVIEDYDYNYELIVEFNDGTKETLNYFISRAPELTITPGFILDDMAEFKLELDSKFAYMIKNVELCYNDKNYYYDYNGLKSIVLEDLTSSTTYEITLYFYDYSGKLLFKKTYTFKTI